MNLESLLLTAMFSLAAVAFLGVLNARGLWRTSLAALLALLCLGAALWHTAAYRAARVTGEFSAPGSAGPSGIPAPAQTDPGTVDPAADADMAGLLAATRALRDSMAAEDPSRARALSDSEYQAFEARAAHHLARARMLRERAARLASAPPSPGRAGLEEAAELLNLALQSLNGAARDLQGFFRATGRDEEQNLQASFRQGVDAADAPLRRAESRAGSPAPGFEAPEP